MDEATYRLLRDLEGRAIQPEDYDLLGRLDESVKPTTLDSEHLRIFPLETYQKLPLCTKEANHLQVEFGVDFWRLPLLDNLSEGTSSSPVGGKQSSSDSCGICILDFQEGDELRTLLPCGHRFHRECI